MISNVRILTHLNGPEAEEHYIHEIKVRPTAEGLPKMLMIHGFGGGGAQFYKMIPHLRHYFQVYTMDLLG